MCYLIQSHTEQHGFIYWTGRCFSQAINDGQQYDERSDALRVIEDEELHPSSRPIKVDPHVGKPFEQMLQQQARERREDPVRIAAAAEDARVREELAETPEDDQYIPIRAYDVPANVRFDVTPQTRGQIREEAYGTTSRHEAGPGDPYYRIADRSDNSLRYYKRR